MEARTLSYLTSEEPKAKVEDHRTETHLERRNLCICNLGSRYKTSACKAYYASYICVQHYIFTRGLCAIVEDESNLSTSSLWKFFFVKTKIIIIKKVGPDFSISSLVLAQPGGPLYRENWNSSGFFPSTILSFLFDFFTKKSILVPKTLNDHLT